VNDRLALVSFGQRYEIVSRFTADKNKVQALLRNVSAGWEGTDYEQALRGAESLFAELGGSASRELFLISDFQAVGWTRANAAFKLGNDIKLTPIDVGGNLSPSNVAITGVAARGQIFSQKYSENLAVQISNFGETPRDRLLIDFQMNEQTLEKREISLAPRESRTLEFTGFNLAEGANRCVIDLGSSDFLPDNRFYFTIRRVAPAKALIVESASRGRSESFYLQSALTMNEGLPFTFTLKTAGVVDPSSISDYSLVILNDAVPLSSALAESITRFVGAGGQLIVSTGPRTEAEAFNRLLGNIAPARLTQAVQNGTDETVAISDINFEHPIFQVFRHGGRLTAARVARYFRSEPTPNATVSARFEDGAPALIESTFGKGRVLLFTSSLGTSWNDLPLTPHYLPFVQQLVRYASGQELSSWHALGQTFVVRKEQDSAPAVDSPSGARLTENRLTPDGDLLVIGKEPGFYRLRHQAGPDFAAVDIDGAEGDFSKLDFSAFMSGVTGGAENSNAAGALNKSTNEEIEARQRIWWPLLLVALMLLVTESLISRRTKVVKMVG
jgi:hypothetical protein